VSVAIVNLFKARRADAPAMRALRSITFADALTAIYTLQRSMLVTFPGMQQGEIVIFNLATGTAVCLLVLVLGLELMGGKTIMTVKDKIAKANEKIAETVTGGYKKVEETVVEGYKKVEDAVTEGYRKVEDKMVDTLFAKEGESTEQAKERLKGKIK